jgi:hypothetical protein
VALWGQILEFIQKVNEIHMLPYLSISESLIRLWIDFSVYRINFTYSTGIRYWIRPLRAVLPSDFSAILLNNRSIECSLCMATNELYLYSVKFSLVLMKFNMGESTVAG